MPLLLLLLWLLLIRRSQDTGYGDYHCCCCCCCCLGLRNFMLEGFCILLQTLVTLPSRGWFKDAVKDFAFTTTHCRSLPWRHPKNLTQKCLFVSGWLVTIPTAGSQCPLKSPLQTHRLLKGFCWEKILSLNNVVKLWDSVLVRSFESHADSSEVEFFFANFKLDCKLQLLDS